MKTKIISILALAALPATSHGQTNTFPSSGHAGIGTTAPSSVLEIVTPGQGTPPLKVFSNYNNYQLLNLGAADSSAGVLDLYHNDNISFHFDPRNWKDSYILSGKFGFGTQTPEAKIHMSYNYGGTLLKVERATQAAEGFLSFDVSSNVPWLKIQRGSSQQYGLRVGADGSPGGLFQIMDGSDPRMTVNETGKVGIGTTVPAHELSVNGTIQAKEVIVETGWSDFVFEDSYHLRSLSEVEDHIAEHGHLPDVPSAAIVESEGLSVGEAQKIMMQKIEELTLYVIAQQKEIDQLKSKLSQQNARYNSE